MEKLTEKVESNKNCAAKKFSKPTVAEIKRAPPMNNDLNRRLIYQRAVLP